MLLWNRHLAFFMLHFFYSFVDCTVNILDCTFKNEHYFLEEMNLEPKWGKNPSTIVFESEDKFKSFLTEITRIYNEVLTMNNYNTIDSFVQFHDDYAKFSNGSSIKYYEFYYQYTYKFRPLEGGVSLAIEILKKISELKSQFPEVINKGFLASSPIGLKEQNYKMLEREKPGSWLTFSNVHQRRMVYAVATLRVQVEQKTIFVLFHPEYYFAEPIVLVQGKSNDPLNSKLNLIHQDRKFVFRFFPGHKDYIVMERSFEGVHHQVYDYELIYVGQSYCSVMETSDKRSYLRPEKSLTKRKDGKIVAAIYVDLKDAINPRTRKIKAFLSTENQKMLTIRIPEDLTSAKDETVFKDILQPAEINRIEKIAKAFGYKEDALIKHLFKFLKVVSNTDFVDSILQLNDSFDKDFPATIRKGILGQSE